MRTVQASEITKNIREMCIEANHFLSSDMKEVFDQALGINRKFLFPDGFNIALASFNPSLMFFVHLAFDFAAFGFQFSFGVVELAAFNLNQNFHIGDDCQLKVVIRGFFGEVKQLVIRTRSGRAHV